MRSLDEIEKDAIEELEEWVKDNPDDDPTDEAIFEIADSSTPIYNYDILQLAASNLFLATDAPDIGPAFDGSPTPINIIAANIYEYISNALYQRWSEIEKEKEEEEDEEG